MTASFPPTRAPRPSRRARQARPARRVVLIAGMTVAALASTSLVGCSNEDTGGGAFCAALADRMPVIETPVADAAGIDALVDAYEELDARTPLAIAEPWSALTELMRTAATVVPDDPSSVQAMADAAYATERPAREVATWVATTCGFAMPAMQGLEGPVDPPPSTAKANKDGKRAQRSTTTAP